MKLLVTIDTEEDNWGTYIPTGATVENVARLPRLQELFDSFEVRPTYLVTYPVVTDKRAVSILKKLLETGKCEIGTHCHPWNTPPLEEEPNERSSMLCNLTEELQYRKMECLHEAIVRNLGIVPRCFRAGRWGFDQTVGANLYKLGYEVDSSISPFMDWSEHFGPDFSDRFPLPYRFSPHDVFRQSAGGPMVEVPITIGFAQKDFARCNLILKRLMKSRLRRLKAVGILYKLRLLNRIWLSPEISSTREMKRLTLTMAGNNYPLLNMTFHSPAIVPGLSPFVKTPDDEQRFLQRTRTYLSFARQKGIDSIVLSRTTDLI